MHSRLVTLLIFCLFYTVLIGQQHEAEENSGIPDSISHEAEHAHHMIQVVLGHTHIFDGRDFRGEKKWLILPTWGINYNYKFDDKWQLGLHTDMIVEEFKVERRQDEVIVERKRPVTVALMGGYKTRSPFTFLVGGGIEFEKEEHLGFMKFGIEPGWHFGHGQWEVSVVISYEIIFNNYDSWLIGFGIARLF